MHATKQTSGNFWRSWGVTILCLVLMIVVVLCFVTRTTISGSSMDPTLHDGQWLLCVGTKVMPFLEPQQGDIVVLYASSVEKFIVKRVIATPGDTLQILNNQVIVNGSVLDEPYIKEPMYTQDIPSVTLGPDDYFVMGDNRNVSLDSRMIGLVDSASIHYLIYLQYQIPLLIALCSVILLLGYIAITAGTQDEEEDDFELAANQQPVSQ